MDTAQSPARDSAACCGVLLPLLMEVGLPSTVPEVRGALRRNGSAGCDPLAPGRQPTIANPHCPRPCLVSQVRSLALDVLTQAVRSAGPAPLAPLAPALVPGLLEALSGLEVRGGDGVQWGGGERRPACHKTVARMFCATVQANGPT
jgi:hypothetical protein